MPTWGFRFRAYTNERTLRALKAQLKLACESYNTLRWADSYFYSRDGKGLRATVYGYGFNGKITLYTHLYRETSLMRNPLDYLCEYLKREKTESLISSIKRTTGS